MKEMIKRKKEQGFTLIELMIVIAVIGIMAIVLVPKVGTIKTQTKATGLDTNIRLVEGYVQSKITKWADKEVTPTKIQADIVAAFESGSDKIKNPFNSSEEIATSTVSGEEYALIVGLAEDSTSTDKKGAVVVQIAEAKAYIPGPPAIEATPLTITITAHDNNTGAIIDEKTVKIVP